MTVPGISPFEQAVLDMLIAGDDVVLVVLRRQVAAARCVLRESSGTGFYCTFEIPSDAPAVVGAPDFEIGDVDATLEGLRHGAGFLLFVRDGRINMLEGYSYDEEWPEEVGAFALSYRQVPRELFGPGNFGVGSQPPRSRS